MRIGVAYYPEYWPEERWPEDARLMKEAGVDLVRIGEFAWSRLEPRRLQYDMAWLGTALGVLGAAGLQVVMCTPTAAPPAWLFDRHPSMVPVAADGRPWHRGSLHDACVNSHAYRRYVRRIVREVAREVGTRSEITAWQVDNEPGTSPSANCYCDACEQAFREWLKRRYGTIERLNKMWGTAFWGQEFGDWQFIPVPRLTPAGPHPSLALDYQRFTAASVRDFYVEQRELIAEYAGGDRVVTTNSLGLGADAVNQFWLGSVTDVASCSNYPAAADRLDRTALRLDLTRSAKHKPFWVLGQQAGAVLVPGARSQPRPGQLRLWSYQAAARGAEMICYYPWRTCPTGQQMHWYGMLDADGSRPRRFDELAGTIAELKARAQLWEGAPPRTRVAIVLDYDSMWALRADSMGAALDYRGHFEMLYGLLRRQGMVVDVLPPDERPAAECAALLVPMPLVGRPVSARCYADYVRDGGRLLVTAPAGHRTEHNTWASAVPPGPLADLLGLRVVEQEVFGGGSPRVRFGREEFGVVGFGTRAELADAGALGVYAGGPFDGEAAVTRRALGAGAAYYVGAVSAEPLYECVLRAVLDDAGLGSDPWSSASLEVIPLQAAEDRPARTWVLNHSAEPCRLPLPEGATRRDLLTDAEHSVSVPLPAYGVALLEG